MDFDGRIRELGAVDVDDLAQVVADQDADVWQENELRQNAFEVHRDTQSMVLVFTETASWPELVVQKMPAWDRLIETAGPLMHDVIERHYPPGGTIIRAMAAKLKPAGKIKPHKDSHPSFHIGHRIHVPVTTNSRVRFSIDGRPFHLAVGQAYEINNQKVHSVANRGQDDRITLIFDYVPPESLARLSQSAA